jgi:hypothetical protein
MRSSCRCGRPATRSTRPRWSPGARCSAANRAAPPAWPVSRPTTRWPSGSPKRTGAGWNCMPGSTPTARATRRPSRRWRRRTWRAPAGAGQAYGDQLWMDPGEPEPPPHTRWPWWPTCCAATTWTACTSTTTSTPTRCRPAAWTCPSRRRGLRPLPAGRRHAGARRLAARATSTAWCRRCHTVRSIKPLVRVGVSPFGVGRPDRRPPGISGFSQFDKLYADVERWLENGWLDYLAPQLYWQIDRAGLQFPVLLDYWLAENRARRHVWPGLFTSQVTRGEPLGPRAWPAREVLDQVLLQRTRSRRLRRCHRPHPLQHGRADAGPRRHRHAAADGPLRAAGAGAGHALAGRHAAVPRPRCAWLARGGHRTRRR